MTNRTGLYFFNNFDTHATTLCKFRTDSDTIADPLSDVESLSVCRGVDVVCGPEKAGCLSARGGVVGSMDKSLARLCGDGGGNFGLVARGLGAVGTLAAWAEFVGLGGLGRLGLWGGFVVAGY